MDDRTGKRILKYGLSATHLNSPSVATPDSSPTSSNRYRGTICSRQSCLFPLHPCFFWKQLYFPWRIDPFTLKICGSEISERMAEIYGSTPSPTKLDHVISFSPTCYHGIYKQRAKSKEFKCPLTQHLKSTINIVLYLLYLTSTCPST